MSETMAQPIKVLLCMPSLFQAEALAEFLRLRLAKSQIVVTCDVEQAAATLESQGPFDLLMWCNVECAPRPVETLKVFQRIEPNISIAILAATMQPETLALLAADNSVWIVPATTSAEIATGILHSLATGGRCVGRAVESRLLASESLEAMLSKRQRDVLELVGRAQSNKSIANLLGLGENTVKSHMREIMRRLGVKNRTEVALFASHLKTRDIVVPSYIRSKPTERDHIAIV